MTGHRIAEIVATLVSGLSLLLNGSLAVLIPRELPYAVAAIPVLYGAGAAHALVAILVLNVSSAKLSAVDETARKAGRLRGLALAGWISVLLVGVQLATGAFHADVLGIVIGCMPFVACASACGLVGRRLEVAPPRPRPRLKWALVVLVVAVLAYGFADLVRLEADDWAAFVVDKTKGPAHVTVVNATNEIHEVEIGRGAFTCHVSCLKPGKRGHCEPEYYGPSLLRARLPLAGFLEHSNVPFVELPVPVRWNSHGTVEVYVTDAGFVVDGGFSTDFF